MMIVDLLGFPTKEELENVTDSDALSFMSRLPKKKTKSFEKEFKAFNPDAVDLMRKMLAFDPSKRITVEDALAHPYLKDLHAPEDEPATGLVSGFDFDFELFDLTN